MGVIIYVSGDANIDDLTKKQKEKILQIKVWDEPVFIITGNTPTTEELETELKRRKGLV